MSTSNVFFSGSRREPRVLFRDVCSELKFRGEGKTYDLYDNPHIGELYLLEQFDYRTFADVQRFHEEVFEKVDDDVLRDIGAFEPGNWEGWPDGHGTKDQRVNFWFEFQDKLLAVLGKKSPAVSQPQWRYKDCRNEVVGHDRRETSRPDVVLVHKDRVHEPTHFKEVYFAADFNLKDSNKLLQVVRYARAVLFHHPEMGFVHGFSLEKATMRNWIVNRSGAFSGPAFNINEDKTKFVEVFLGYLRMSVESLGCMEAMQRAGENIRLTLPTGTTILLDPAPLFHTHAVVCRGTACFVGRTEKVMGAEHVESCLVRIYWIEDGEVATETEFLDATLESKIETLVRVIECTDITSTSQLQPPLELNPENFIYVRPGHANGKFLSTNTGWSNRRCQALVTTSLPGRSLDNFQSLSELVGALKDVIMAHYELYTKTGSLHRDISDRNIVLTEAGRGCLVDFTHAIFYTQTPERVFHKTGGHTFVAMGLLNGYPTHTYRHDLESFFYVFIWVLYRCQGKCPNGWSDPEEYRKGIFVKMDFVCQRVEDICSKCLPEHQCEALRDLVGEFIDALFFNNYGYKQTERPFTESPQNPEKMFKAVDCAFSKALKELKKSEPRG